MFSCNETNIVVVSGADICMHFKDQLTTSVSCEAKKKQNRNPYLLFYFLLFSIHIIISFYIMVKKDSGLNIFYWICFSKGLGTSSQTYFALLTYFDSVHMQSNLILCEYNDFLLIVLTIFSNKNVDT